MAPPTGDRYVGVLCQWNDTREAANPPPEDWREQVRAGLKDLPFVTVEVSSCGSKVVYQHLEDIPLEDVPCPCGDPNHWIVKYECNEEGP